MGTERTDALTSWRLRPGLGLGSGLCLCSSCFRLVSSTVSIHARVAPRPSLANLTHRAVVDRQGARKIGKDRGIGRGNDDTRGSPHVGEAMQPSGHRL